MSNILNEFLKLDNDARKAGFKWPSALRIIQNIHNELEEVNEAINNNHKEILLQLELGDLLHSVLSLCIFLGHDPRLILEKYYIKFSNRIDSMLALAKEANISDFASLSHETKLKFWQEGKIVADAKTFDTLKADRNTIK